MVTNSTTADPSAISSTNDYRNWFDKEEESQTDQHENLHASGDKLLTESSDINQIWKSNPFFDQHEQIGPQENFIRCHLDKDHLNRPAAIGYGQENQFYNTTQAYQESNQLPHHHPQMNQFPPLKEDRLMRPVQRYDAAQTPYDPLDSVDPDPIMVGEKPPEAPPAPSISFLPPPILPNPSSYPPAPVPPPYPPQWSNISVVVGTNQVSGQILWVHIY